MPYDPNGNYYENHELDINQLTSAIQNANEKQKISMLELEIAKSTDPAVRARLQTLLNQTLREREHRQKMGFWFGLLFLLLIGLASAYVFLVYFPNHDSVAPPTDNRVTTLNSSSDSSLNDAYYNQEENTQQSNKTSQNANEGYNNQSPDDSNNSATSSKVITKPQLRQWAANIFDAKAPEDNPADVLNNPNMNLSVSKDDDGYATARISYRQSDTVDYFRINSDGQLEENNFFRGDGQPSGWTVVSNTPPTDISQQAQTDHIVDPDYKP